MQLLYVTPNCCKGKTSLCLSKGSNTVKKDRIPAPKSHDKVNFLKSLAPPLMVALLTLSPIGFIPDSLGQTIDVQRGASLFRKACIGCHDAGGNIIQSGATLFLKDLQRNGIDSEEEIYHVTYFGKGRMPGGVRSEGMS